MFGVLSALAVSKAVRSMRSESNEYTTRSEVSTGRLNVNRCETPKYFAGRMMPLDTCSSQAILSTQGLTETVSEQFAHHCVCNARAKQVPKDVHTELSYSHKARGFYHPFNATRSIDR